MKKLVPALLAGSIGMIVANTASAGLSAVGLPDPVNHFPSSITDTNNVALELCLAGDATLAQGPNVICGFDPASNWPGNVWAQTTTGFGVEVFYNRAQAKLTMPNGRRGVYSAGVEASYLNGIPTDGQQWVFGRVRYRIDLPGPGQYKVYHPWLAFPGCLPETYNEPVGGTKAINFTTDIGGGAPFLGVLGPLNNVNPFMKWDPAVAPAAPAGFIGDANVTHKIVGSPCGYNTFRIDGPNVGGAGINTFSSDLFNISGKLATLQAAPLVIDRATYKRVGTAITLNVFAESAAGSTVTLGAQPAFNPAATFSTNAAGIFFARVAATAVPANITLTATSPVPGAPSTVKTVPVTDQVDVKPAVYDAVAQTLAITATSSDTAVPPTLTATVGKTPFPMTFNAATGLYTVTVGTLPAPPFSVTVSSSKGGSDVENIAD